MKVEPVKEWRMLRRRRRWIRVAAGIVLTVTVIALSLYFAAKQVSRERYTNQSTIRLKPASSQPLNLPAPDLLKPITPEEALKENAERAFSARPDTAAVPFNLNADSTSRDRALECLTQAVYYEAAGEGTEGQQAVAQIVLNRMRHPAYPASVCGVVYQGSDRATGCQFTFTCDGSLARAPIPSLWKQAREVAGTALEGRVFAPVGHATHYHADYVLPYWADSLDKSIQIGRHIFYRLKGSLGASRVFAKRYAGHEPSPPSPSAVQVAMEAVQDSGLVGESEDMSGLQAATGDLLISAQPKPQLVADALQGTLVLDGSSSAGPARQGPASNKKSVPCSQNASKPLKPLAADDMHARNTSADCKS